MAHLNTIGETSFSMISTNSSILKIYIYTTGGKCCKVVFGIQEAEKGLQKLAIDPVHIICSH